MGWAFETSLTAPVAIGATTGGPLIPLGRPRTDALEVERRRRSSAVVSTAASVPGRTRHHVVSNTGDVCPAGFLPVVVGKDGRIVSPIYIGTRRSSVAPRSHRIPRAVAASASTMRCAAGSVFPRRRRDPGDPLATVPFRDDICILRRQKRMGTKSNHRPSGEQYRREPTAIQRTKGHQYPNITAYCLVIADCNVILITVGL